MKAVAAFLGLVLVLFVSSSEAIPTPNCYGVGNSCGNNFGGGCCNGLVCGSASICVQGDGYYGNPYFGNNLGGYGVGDYGLVNTGYGLSYDGVYPQEGSFCVGCGCKCSTCFGCKNVYY